MVSRAPLPMHGKVSDVEHSGQTVFRGINGAFKATRYHSLIVDRETCPRDLQVTAETSDGLVMGLSHRSLPIHGVQFHPESILSEHGVTIMRNFFDLAADWNARHRATGGPAAPAGL
jgi:anthranilate synthase component 2